MVSSLISIWSTFEDHNYLEGPQEVGGVFEVASNSENFMDQIFHTDDVGGTCK